MNFVISFYAIICLCIFNQLEAAGSINKQCYKAKTCVHNNHEKCGISSDGTPRRFLDSCDIFEFNCLKNTDFKKSPMLRCKHLKSLYKQHFGNNLDSINPDGISGSHDANNWGSPDYVPGNGGQSGGGNYGGGGGGGGYNYGEYGEIIGVDDYGGGGGGGGEVGGDDANNNGGDGNNPASVGENGDGDENYVMGGVPGDDVKGGMGGGYPGGDAGSGMANNDQEGAIGGDYPAENGGGGMAYSGEGYEPHESVHAVEHPEYQTI